jgi:DNA-3-methyladenine glycosylase II
MDFFSPFCYTENKSSGGMFVYFAYGPQQTEYLKARDPVLGELIDRIGPIRRKVDPDLFSSVVHHIVGQQISTKAQQTIWFRMQNALGTICAETVLAAGPVQIQAMGISMRKAGYILDFAQKVQSGSFDLEGIWQKSDQEAIEQLAALRGVGVWTAQMILLFCMQRPDVLSFDDLAIQRGLRMVYHHRKIDQKLFAKYRRRYSPYGSTASLYLWAVAGGAIPELRDPAPSKKVQAKSKA